LRLQRLHVAPLRLHDGRPEWEGAPCLVGRAASRQPTPAATRHQAVPPQTESRAASVPRRRRPSHWAQPRAAATPRRARAAAGSAPCRPSRWRTPRYRPSDAFHGERVKVSCYHLRAAVATGALPGRLNGDPFPVHGGGHGVVALLAVTAAVAAVVPPAARTRPTLCAAPAPARRQRLVSWADLGCKACVVAAASPRPSCGSRCRAWHKAVSNNRPTDLPRQ